MLSWAVYWCNEFQIWTGIGFIIIWDAVKNQSKAEKKSASLDELIAKEQQKTQKLSVKFTKALQGKESFKRYPEGFKKDIIASAQDLCTKPGEKDYPLLDIIPDKEKEKLEKKIEKKTKKKGSEDLGNKYRIIDFYISWFNPVAG